MEVLIDIVTFLGVSITWAVIGFACFCILLIAVFCLVRAGATGYFKAKEQFSNKQTSEGEVHE